MTPSISDWLKKRFGTSDDSLLDSDVYSDEELRKDKVKLKRERQRLEQEIEKHSQRYKELVKEGASASEPERRTLAQRAKIEKKKFELKNEKRREVESKLGVVLTVEAVRELLERHDESSDLAIDSVLEEGTYAEELQTLLEDQMQHSGLDAEMMLAIQEELELGEPEMEDAVEDVQAEVIENMAESDLSIETIDSSRDGVAGFESPGLGDNDQLAGEDRDESELLDQEILGAEGPVDVTVRSLDEGITEAVLRVRDHYLLCSMYADRYAVTWEAPLGVEEFLDAVEQLDDELPIEVVLETPDSTAVERQACTLAAARTDDRFPGACAFLMLDYGEHTLSWEREGTHTDSHELTATVESYEGEPFRTVYLRSLEGELDTPELTEMLGRLSEVLESDAPVSTDEGGVN